MIAAIAYFGLLKQNEAFCTEFYKDYNLQTWIVRIELRVIFIHDESENAEYNALD